MKHNHRITRHVVPRGAPDEWRAMLRDLRPECAREPETLHEAMYGPVWNRGYTSAAHRIRHGARP